MKIKIKNAPSLSLTHDNRELNVKTNSDVDITKCYTGVGITTDEGVCFGFCARDFGLEVSVNGESIGMLNPDGFFKNKPREKTACILNADSA